MTARARNKLKFGVGINDADYAVCQWVDAITPEGKNYKKLLWICPVYRKWSDMLKRCYSKKNQIKQPTYRDCSVCIEWLRFSNFKTWMEKQDWQGNDLDKDLLVIGNKVYSPQTCVFLKGNVNSFILDSASARGDLPLGVTFERSKNKYRSQCGNFVNNGVKSQKFIGYFDCPQQAHLAWKKRKHELALQLAELQTDERVAAALRVRYL
jgi:hypothetical protein